MITCWLLAEKDSKDSISRQLKARMQTIYVNLVILAEIWVRLGAFEGVVGVDGIGLRIYVFLIKKRILGCKMARL
jgi:hypothetical protein